MQVHQYLNYNIFTFSPLTKLSFLKVDVDTLTSRLYIRLQPLMEKLDFCSITFPVTRAVGLDKMIKG